MEEALMHALSEAVLASGPGDTEGVGTGWNSLAGWSIALLVVVLLGGGAWWSSRSTRRRR
jgi:hypothetical protein